MWSTACARTGTSAPSKIRTTTSRSARREQDDAEFFATAVDVVRGLRAEARHLRTAGQPFPRGLKALEIGCGPGRIMRPLSADFAEIHGMDVSDEMIRLAREKLRDIPNAHLHHTGASDLPLFPDESFDFVYSYAVFQHIPSREVVLGYLAEARRVLKPGGILRCQINGLPETSARYTTWEGVRIPAAEVADFAVRHDFQLWRWKAWPRNTCGPPGASSPPDGAPRLTNPAPRAGARDMHPGYQQRAHRRSAGAGFGTARVRRAAHGETAGRLRFDRTWRCASTAGPARSRIWVRRSGMAWCS